MRDSPADTMPSPPAPAMPMVRSRTFRTNCKSGTGGDLRRNQPRSTAADGFPAPIAATAVLAIAGSTPQRLCGHEEATILPTDPQTDDGLETHRLRTRGRTWIRV